MFFNPEMAPDAGGDTGPGGDTCAGGEACVKGDACAHDACAQDAVAEDDGCAEDDPAAVAARERAAFDSPDTLDHVVEIAGMITMHAAQRLVGIDLVRREALADARVRDGLVGVVERSVRLEIAAALRITEHAADELLRFADALVHRYPVVLASFGSAGMTERHAQLLVETLDTVEPELRDRIQEQGIVLAETQPVGTFRRKLRRLVDTVRAVTLTERYEAAVARRRVCVEPAEDGMAWLSALVPAVEAHAVFGRITAIAKILGSQDGEARTLDQLRADIACDLLIDGNTTLHPPEAHGIRATVAITVPALTLLEAGDTAGGDRGAVQETGVGVAVVEGIGPIPLARARELCGGAEGWMRILTHPETGMVLSVSRDHYRPPPGLRKLARWRADRCMAPGCGIPATRCEIDHTLAWEHGGHTSLHNLNPLCKGHHTVKHHGGWTVRQVDGTGGALEWVSPTGRSYTVHPERPLPVFRPTEHHPPPF